LIGDEPLLLGKGPGEVGSHGLSWDIRKLDMAVKESDICLIDTFPSMNPSRFMAVCKDIAKKIVII